MDQEASTDIRAKSGNGFAKMRWLALAALIIVTIGGIAYYWHHTEIYPSTDNAYTGANIVRVSPEVSGAVERVYVVDDQHVRAGDPLFDLDGTLYDAALRNARAQFDAAAAAAGTAGDNLKQAANTLADKRKGLEDALAKYRQAKDAQAPGQPESDQLKTAEQGWQAALKAFGDAEQAFDDAQEKPITVTTPTVQLRAAAAGLEKAMHDRVKAHVTAAGDGWVSNLSLRPGTTVQAGTPLFAIIEDGQWWVDANFKETDLKRIKIGQPATVQLDMYPGTKLEGVVESVSKGSGSTFSVLPPENATGNWVKVTQRFPVRIRLTKPQQSADTPLRVGASATVTIDTAGQEK